VKFDLDSPWPKTLPEEQQLIAEELPLRRDVVTLLSYLRDNKVTGTQSTGNFPLKAVHEICARFVDPPKLEDDGDYKYRVRSETEVWPLHFRHILAAVGGLITGGYEPALEADPTRRALPGCAFPLAGLAPAGNLVDANQLGDCFSVWFRGWLYAARIFKACAQTSAGTTVGGTGLL
jgi:hypothetical protein